MGLLTPCSVPRGGILYTMTVLGVGFSPFKSCPGGLSRGMVLDEIDTCITIMIFINEEKTPVRTFSGFQVPAEESISSIV